jgi:hypothetical protein
MSCSLPLVHSSLSKSLPLQTLLPWAATSSATILSVTFVVIFLCSILPDPSRAFLRPPETSPSLREASPFFSAASRMLRCVVEASPRPWPVLLAAGYKKGTPEPSPSTRPPQPSPSFLPNHSNRLVELYSPPSGRHGCLGHGSNSSQPSTLLHPRPLQELPHSPATLPHHLASRRNALWPRALVRPPALPSATWGRRCPAAPRC